MTEPVAYPTSRGSAIPAQRGDSLADVLERVLDKGIVIAGDIRIDLLDIELLTIRIRLLISSADKAQELGMAWWRDDPFYTGAVGDDRADGEDGEDGPIGQLVDHTEELARRVARLEEGNGAARSGRAGEGPVDRPDETG